MATDFDSQLPIKSIQDGLDERVLVKIQDAEDPSGAEKGVQVSEKKAHVRVHAKDSEGADKQVLLSQEGHVQSNGDYDAATNKRPSSQGLIASDRDASPSETTMNKRPTAIAGNDDKVAMDVAISDSQGNRIDENNPLAIYLAESPAEEVDDYNDADAIASGASANHDYTVTASTTFKSLEFEGSASAKAKWDLQIEDGVGAGTFTTVATRFNSTANPNISGKYKKGIAAGVIIRIVKTNLDNKAQSVYSEIKGLEI
jgi:hypothetical protein